MGSTSNSPQCIASTSNLLTYRPNTPQVMTNPNSDPSFIPLQQHQKPLEGTEYEINTSSETQAHPSRRLQKLKKLLDLAAETAKLFLNNEDSRKFQQHHMQLQFWPWTNADEEYTCGRNLYNDFCEAMYWKIWWNVRDAIEEEAEWKNAEWKESDQFAPDRGFHSSECPISAEPSHGPKSQKPK
jgi:hypothetical protein